MRNWNVFMENRCRRQWIIRGWARRWPHAAPIVSQRWTTRYTMVPRCRGTRSRTRIDSSSIVLFNFTSIFPSFLILFQSRTNSYSPMENPPNLGQRKSRLTRFSQRFEFKRPIGEGRGLVEARYEVGHYRWQWDPKRVAEAVGRGAARNAAETKRDDLGYFVGKRGPRGNVSMRPT